MRLVISTRDRKQELSDFGYTLAQIPARDGSPLTRAQIQGIDLFVYDAADPDTTLYSITLDKNSVFFDTLQLTPNWSEDTKGYNFAHYLTQQDVFPIGSTTNIERGGHTYILEYRINTIGSGLVWVKRQSTSSPIISTGTASGGGGGGGGNPDFALTASPTVASVFVGFDVAITIGVTAIDGFPGTVTLTPPAAVPGLTYVFDSTTVIAGGSTVLHISAGSAAAPGVDNLVVTGTFGTTTHTAPITLTVQNVGGGVAGFTAFAVVADTVITYVSDSIGNDTWDGLFPDHSTGGLHGPVKTIAVGYGKLRHLHPDWMLLMKGDTWTGQNLHPDGGGRWKKGGLSAAVDASGARTGMMRIGAYGTGARPKIDISVNTDGFFAIGPDAFQTERIDHLAITELEITSSAYDGTVGQPRGIFCDGGMVDILIEANYIHNLWQGVLLFPGGGRSTSMSIRRNIITEHYNVNNPPNSVSTVQSQGMYCEGVDGCLIEENLYDNCGWIDGNEATRPSDGSNFGNLYRRCIYIQNGDNGFTVRNNTFCRTDGMQMRGGGIATDNLFLQIAMGIIHGNGNSPEAGGVTGSIRGNVHLDGNNLSLNGNDARGWGITCGNTSSLDCSYNVLAHNTHGTGPSVYKFDFNNGNGNPQGCQNVTFDHNVSYEWVGDGANSKAQVGFYSAATFTNFIWTNNFIQMVGDPNPTDHFIFSTLRADGTNCVGPDLKQIHGGGNFCFRPASGSNVTLFQDVNGLRTGPQFFADIAGVGGAGQDTTSVVETTPHAFTDPNRTILTYMTNVLGGAFGTTLLAFITQAKLNSKDAWDTRFTAHEVNAYVRTGFDLPAIVP